MFLEDKDLVSIQEVRNLIRDAKKAQAELAKMSQEQIDTIVKVVAKLVMMSVNASAKMGLRKQALAAGKTRY